MEIDSFIIAAIIAFLLDSMVGDPYWMPHPIRIFGSSISLLERWLNQGAMRRLKGGVMWLALVGGCYTLLFFINKALLQHPIMWMIFTTLFIFWGVSTRCLIDEARKVERILNRGNITRARQQLSMIVGRDTSQLTPAKIRSAVIETLSENLSDGTIAPLLFLALGGVPMMMAYKMVNTLDSMVGYKSDRYKEFGYVSAKMDDVANFIPSRITALLIALVELSPKAVRSIFKFANRHTSPNAGYPEAAIAGVLDCQLGGDNVYFGKVVEKPYIGDNNRELTHSDLVRSCLVNAKVSLVGYIIVIVIFLL